MSSAPLDAETLREVFVYLYRCWLQRYLNERPERLALSPNDGVLVSQNFTLYYSTGPVDNSAVSELQSRFRPPVFLIAPVFPRGCLGVTDFSPSQKVGKPFDGVLQIVREKLDWLYKHRERGLSKREAYETQEDGLFSIWKARNATRLLLEPSSGSLYGYAIIRNAPNDFFLRKSKSCKQEGSKVGSGTYKRCQHRVENKSYLNFDLLYDTGEVLLLHLTLAGAGYKAFPRQVPEPQPTL